MAHGAGRHQRRPLYGRAVTTPDNPLTPGSLSVFTGSVFHYTSSAGLLGTLEGGAIRASAAASLNDLGEVRQGWEMIRTLLAVLPTSAAVEMLQRFAADPMKGQHEVFVLSASTRGDDANQWRLYADQGRGYALEFDGAVRLAAVSDAAARATPASRRSIGTLAKDFAAVSPWLAVLYSESAVRLALEELVDGLEYAGKRIDATSGIPEEEVALQYDEVQADAYEALATIAHLIKGEGFSGENEVRVVATFMWGEEHIRYRAALLGIVAYATLAQSPGGPRHTVLRPPAAGSPVATTLPIRSIRLGPLLGPEHENTVRAFLRARKLKHVTISRSGVPLR